MKCDRCKAPMDEHGWSARGVTHPVGWNERPCLHGSGCHRAADEAVGLGLCPEHSEAALDVLSRAGGQDGRVLPRGPRTR